MSLANSNLIMSLKYIISNLNQKNNRNSIKKRKLRFWKNQMIKIEFMKKKMIRNKIMITNKRKIIIMTILFMRQLNQIKLIIIKKKIKQKIINKRKNIIKMIFLIFLLIKLVMHLKNLIYNKNRIYQKRFVVENVALYSELN